MRIKIMITVQIIDNFRNMDFSRSKIEKLAKMVCRRFKLADATVSIAIVDNAQIRRVNAQFLNRKHSTDVISFDLSDNDTNAPPLFELVVNADRAVEEAGRRSHSGEAELALYITHGLLHNLGFDDSTEMQAKKMHDTEDEILRRSGFGLVYNKSNE